MFDVWITLVFGVIGYLMRKLAFLSIIRGVWIWIQVRTHAPEIAIEESDDGPLCSASQDVGIGLRGSYGTGRACRGVESRGLTGEAEYVGYSVYAGISALGACPHHGSEEGRWRKSQKALPVAGRRSEEH